LHLCLPEGFVYIRSHNVRRPQARVVCLLCETVLLSQRLNNKGSQSMNNNGASGYVLRRALAAAVVGLSTASMEQSLAQEPGRALEEVVVTAQKREQSVQDVGISITAITSDQLAQLRLESSTDITRLA